MKSRLIPKSIALRIPQKNIKGNCAEIVWSDQSITVHSSFSLRLQCPCATCKETGGPRGVPPMIEIKSFNWVGNYAINFIFSDGHNLGIFSYETLRKINEADNEI